MEVTEASTDRWMDKENVILYIFYGYKNLKYINAILLIHEKEGNPVICNNMDGPWGNYAKWNKSDRERQILYDLTYMWKQKKPNL